jgi:hypothetical protein
MILGYAVRIRPYFVQFSFSTTGNNNMADAQTCDVDMILTRLGRHMVTELSKNVQRLLRVYFLCVCVCGGGGGGGVEYGTTK